MASREAHLVELVDEMAGEPMIFEAKVTVLATGGVLAALQGSGARRPLGVALSATVGAQVATAPVLLMSFVVDIIAMVFAMPRALFPEVAETRFGGEQAVGWLFAFAQQPFEAPDEVRRRALEDDILRGDLVSESGTVTAIVVGFDEDRIDAVRSGDLGGSVAIAPVAIACAFLSPRMLTSRPSTLSVPPSSSSSR